REAFAAAVETRIGSRCTVRDLVAVVARDADVELTERTKKEAQLLEELAPMPLPFRVPRALDLVATRGRAIPVCSFAPGAELDFRRGRAWEIVGAVAAGVHSVRADSLLWLEPRHATRRAHARAQISELDVLPEPERTAGRAWMEAHLPPGTPSTFVHGDLLGQ